MKVFALATVTLLQLLVGSSRAQSCTEPAGCDICPTGIVENPDLIVEIELPGAGNMETATCAEWFAFVCIFSEPDVCNEFQNALTICCSAGAVPTPAPVPGPTPTPPPISSDKCIDGTGCDICGDGVLKDDSLVVTIDLPGTGNQETATCGEWYLAGCAFIEPTAECITYQDLLTDCCEGGSVPTPPSPTAPLPTPPAPTPTPPPPPTTRPPTDPPAFVSLTPSEYGGCIEVGGDVDDKVELEKCRPEKARQQFRFDGNLVRSALGDNKCLQAGSKNAKVRDGKFMRLYPCDANNDRQQFTWKSPDGPLKLKEYPEFCVVFRGDTADIGKDPIIVKKCDNASMKGGWEVFV